jgi:hypothetical protein
MKNNTIKMIASWVVGIISCVVISLIFNAIMKSVGIVNYIDFGETLSVTHGSGRYSYDTEEDGAFTTAGTAFNFLSIMLAARIGMAVYSGHFGGGVSKTGNIVFLAWLYGLAALGVGGSVLFALFHSQHSSYLNVVRNILELPLAGGIFYYGWQWSLKEIQKIKDDESRRDSN